MTNEEAKVKIEKLKKMQLDGRYCSCPRCGINLMDEKPTRNALSRHADIYICDTCGTQEAVLVYTKKSIPLTEWDFIKTFFD